VKFAEYEVYGEDEKNYKKDRSWVWVDLPDTKIEEDEEHIKVQYRDSSGGGMLKRKTLKKMKNGAKIVLLLLPVLRV